MDISPESFQRQSTSSKLDTLYDHMLRLEDQVKEISQKCERKKFRESSFAAFGGMIGGFLTIMASKIFK